MNSSAFVQPLLGGHSRASSSPYMRSALCRFRKQGPAGIAAAKDIMFLLIQSFLLKVGELSLKHAVQARTLLSAFSLALFSSCSSESCQVVLVQLVCCH